MSDWYTYLIKCADGALYCGVTTDIRRRVSEHNSGKGAKYTRRHMKRPVELAWLKKAESKSAAYKEEYRIKHITREEKLKLVSEQPVKLALMSMYGVFSEEFKTGQNG